MDIMELTEYERQRKAQEIDLEAEMTINPRSLYRHYSCPICLDVLSETRVAPDCMHRFCKKCVDKAVKKDCPVCRRRLPSNARSFKDNPAFDTFIKTILNNHKLGKLNDATKQTSQALECEIILRHLHGEQTRYLKCPYETTIDHLARYLAIRPEGSKIPNLNNDARYKLSILLDAGRSEYGVLEGGLTLADVKTKYKLDADKPLELYFYNPPPESH